ncbi:MAG: DUF6498-containing protein [Candidatus Micrarchaeota archaeon]
MDLLKYPSLIVLIIANLIPLYGAYALGWSAAELMLLYWTESAIIGFFNLIKMALAQGLPPGNAPPQALLPFKVFMIPFFVLHYGGFMFGHLIFIIAFFIKDFSLDLLLSVLLGSAFLFISHGISFVLNYLGKKEYLKANVTGLMAAPYARIILMHIAIILGAFINAPVVILIAGKTIVDAFSHLSERERYS